MKRIDLVREIESFGCVLVRHGAKHDWYRNPNTGVAQPVPRHREVEERLARKIVRTLSNEQKRS
jgi:mRNA interferase HicA